MSDSISTISSLSSTIELIQRSQTSLNQLSQENATGTRSISLQGYGSDAPKVLDLQVSINETQSYISNGTQINTYLQSYDDTLTQLSSDAAKLQTALQSVNSGTSDPTSLTNLKTLVQGLLADVGATLNTQVGDRYIYAGSRYDTAPTVDLTQLATPSTPSSLTLASGSTTPPTIPDYDVDYASGSPPGTVTSGTPYYGQSQVNISASETLSFGVSADDPSIQQLVYALQQAGGGAASSGTTQTQFLTNALSAVNQAVSGLQTLGQENSANQSTLSTAQTTQTTALSTLQGQFSDLTQVDSATVATELSSVENQLEGTYKATSTLLGLSLLKYL